MKNLAFGTIFDNLLGLDARTLRVRTVLYALLYDGIVVSDSWLLTNAGLHDLLGQADGVELLRGGIIIPMLRSDMPQLSLRRQHHADRPGLLHGFINDPHISTLVDTNSLRGGQGPLLYDPKEVGANYRRLSDRLMQYDALAANGLYEESVSKVTHRFAQAAIKSENTNTNTFVKDEVCPLLAPDQAAKLMELVRAPYSLALPTLYGQGVVAPAEFRGHEILRAILGDGRAIGQVMINEGNLGDLTGSYKLTVNDRLASWLVNPQTLETITAAELLMLRDHMDRQEAQLALTAYLAVPSQQNWELLASALEKFLKGASNELFNSRLRQNQIDGDPATSDQLEVKGSPHHVVVGSDQQAPMELADMPTTPKSTEQSEPVQIIGRSAMLPADPPAD